MHLYKKKILRNEFVYGTDPLETNVRKIVDEMTRDEILEQSDASTGETISDDALIGLTQKQRDLGRRDFDAYLFLVWPFIEGYWLAACSLLLLAGPGTQEEGEPASSSSSTIHWYAAKEFESRAQLFGKTMYSQGELSYLEAVSAQTISQAITRYEELGIVVRRKSSAAKPVPLIALDPSYKPRLQQTQQQQGLSEKGTTTTTTTISPGGGGKLWEFLERLSAFRREGKDRRDAGDVVGERLLDVIGRNYPTPVETTRHTDGHARI